VSRRDDSVVGTGISLRTPPIFHERWRATPNAAAGSGAIIAGTDPVRGRSSRPSTSWCQIQCSAQGTRLTAATAGAAPRSRATAAEGHDHHVVAEDVRKQGASLSARTGSPRTRRAPNCLLVGAAGLTSTAAARGGEAPARHAPPPTAERPPQEVARNRQPPESGALSTR
jgi:hypothetical protein